MLHSRGRSRQVSNAALARQASEERRSSNGLIIAPIPVKLASSPPFIRSPSPSPLSSASMSPDYFDQPPSPPRSLEDQVHVAYALDDIHLAKILLLRLKGIEVTSDDDPRIAAVQDEDFDFCFVPNGRLMDDSDERAIKEMQSKELERLEERRRFERLRTCERIWEDQKRRMREERLAIFRQRERKWMEEEDRRKRTEQQQREDQYHRAQKAALADRGPQRTRARLVCYDNLPCTPEKPVSQQFVYDFMVHSVPKLHTSRSPSMSHSGPRLRPPVFDDSRSIPFTAVLDSMQGPLFPVSPQDLTLPDHSPEVSRSASRSHSQVIRRRKRQLLDALLVEMKRTEDELRNSKGKQKAHRLRPVPCLACSTATHPPPSTASNSTSTSRRSSWLSFTGSSPSTPSSSTDSITPPTSPTPSFSSSKSGWFKSSTVSTLAIRPRSWIPTSNALNPNSTFLQHSCSMHSRFTPVLPCESPLPLNPSHPIKSIPMVHHGRRRSTSTVRAAKEGAGLLVRRVSRFVEIAKEFHQTYVNLALSSSTESGSRETGSSEIHKVPDLNSSVRCSSKLREPGYRVNPHDVAAFLSMSSPESDPGYRLETAAAVDTTSPPAPKYIPLRPPPTSNPPRTVLPEPLPYRRVFKPIPTPVRSPFRSHALPELHTTYPSSLFKSSDLFLHQGPLTWRIRSVGNPVYLRLKALHNVIWKGGMVWEGRGRDTALGGGRERIVGVAYDGVGRSSLSKC